MGRVKLMGLIGAMALSATVAEAALSPTVSSAWSRPAAAGMNAAGFLTLANRGAAADALVSAESPIAKRIEIHHSAIDNGVMSMRKMDRVAIPAAGSVTLAPGGYHLMILGLNRALKVGDRAPITLVFASGARVQSSLLVSIQAP